MIENMVDLDALIIKILSDCELRSEFGINGNFVYSFASFKVVYFAW